MDNWPELDKNHTILFFKNSLGFQWICDHWSSETHIYSLRKRRYRQYLIMSCPLNTKWELFSSKRHSNSQALKKSLSISSTMTISLWAGWEKTHMVIFYHSSVVKSNTASFVQHCTRCKGGKRKSAWIFHLKWQGPPDLPYKITKNIGLGKEEKGKLP